MRKSLIYSIQKRKESGFDYIRHVGFVRLAEIFNKSVDHTWYLPKKLSTKFKCSIKYLGKVSKNKLKINLRKNFYS